MTGDDPTRSVITWAWSKTEGNRRKRCADALSNIVGKRDAGNCFDIPLSFADHYFQARYYVCVSGPAGVLIGTPLVLAYDAVKLAAELTKLTGYIATGKCPPSPSSWRSIYWGLEGIKDGTFDFDIMMNPSSQLPHGRFGS